MAVTVVENAMFETYVVHFFAMCRLYFKYIALKVWEGDTIGSATVENTA